MPRYRSAGGLDDSSASDGDTGFVGINQREQPNQLQPGEVVLSQNGRIDGFWQPRKGITLKSGQLATSELPLRLPFWAVDTQVTVTSAARASDVVTLTVSGGHGLDYGAYATATLDPAGSNNTILLTADTAGQSEEDISVAIEMVSDDAEISITSVGRDYTVGVGDNHRMVVSGSSFWDGTYILAVVGSGATEWEWTTDGLARSAPGSRAAIYGTGDTSASGFDTWSMENSSGANVQNAFVYGPISPGDPLPAFAYPDDAKWNWSSGTVTDSDAISQDVIDAINADSSLSALVTASASGAATGTTAAVAQTYLSGGWGATAYLTLGDPANATAPLTGTDDVTAGSRLMTATSDTTLTFAHEGADESLTVDGTYGYLAATLDDNAVGQVYGSCSFSDPSSDLAESAYLVTGQNAKKVLLSTFAISDVPYPSGVTISEDVEVAQSFDRVYLWRDGQRTLEYIPGGRSIESSGYTSASGIVNIELTSHGMSVGDSVTTADIGYVTTDPNGTHTVTTVVDADNFQYVIATGGGDETYTANSGTATAAGFTLAPAGVFTQPQAFNIAGNVWGVSGNVVTFTVAGNTTIKAGDKITVDATDVTELQPMVGNDYEVATASATTITFNAPIGDFAYGTGTSTEYIEFSGRFSQGGGFFHSPAPPWGVSFQRRLWVPYNYTPGGTQTSPTYTDREVRDQIAASDILDPATFDSIGSQFRITPGTSDYVVGLQPFYEDSMVVLNRNSLHLIRGTQGSLADTVVSELTREIGCLARRSVVAQGNNIFFLSDSGVYGLSFVDEYNLRGVEEPLSEKIQPYIDRINKSLAGEAVGVYFNNRYYLAVPLDSSPGAADAKGNNSVLVYNLLNGGWESLDTYGSGDFLIANFIVAQESKRNELFLVNKAGGLHLADDNNNPSDSYSLNPVGDSTSAGVDYLIKSRGYGFGSLERKKYRRAQVQMTSDTDYATDVDFLFSSTDPDTDQFTVVDLVGALGDQLGANESGNIRFRLGNPRGIYGTLTINRKIVGLAAIGRPKVTSIMLEGYENNRQTYSQQ